MQYLETYLSGCMRLANAMFHEHSLNCIEICHMFPVFPTPGILTVPIRIKCLEAKL